MSGKLKILKRLLCVSLAAFFTALTVGAAESETYDPVPYKTYTYWQGYKEKKAVPIKAIYGFSENIDAKRLGISGNFSVTYFCFGGAGLLYALDSQNNKILVLDKEYRLKRTVAGLYDSSGNAVELKGAEGLFITKDGKIYIADTQNNRIIVTDAGGKIIRTVQKPESELIPEDVIFLPKRILQDEQGFIYVLSDGCYYGAMKFDSDFNFIGFFGANTVKTSVLSAVTGFFKNLFSTETKRMNDIQKIPYTFLDCCLDKEGMILTTTSNTDIKAGQIRRLSPGGSNILSSRFNYKTTDGDSFNFGDNSGVTNEDNVLIGNNFGAIAADGDFFYALNTSSGRVFVYDFSSNLIGVFSGGFGTGEQNGVFKKASSIAVAENGDVLIADRDKNQITVFSETEYGALVKKGDTLSNAGRYSEALPYWEKVNRLDKNNQLAIIGIAKAALGSGDYEKAMTYAEKGLDRETYVNAHSKVLTARLKSHFGILFLVILAFAGALTAFLVISSKKKLVIIKNRRLNVALSALLHPIESFKAVQEKNEGSVIIATVFLLLFFIGSTCRQIYAGFMYVIPERDTYNVIYTLLGTVGVVLLWVVVNWGVCVLFEGKVRIKKIYICTCYSLYPLILYSALFMLLSYFVSPSSVSFISVLSTVCTLYFVFMLLSAMMTVHEFGFSKSVGTALFSVVGMGIIGFLIFMSIMLCQDFIGFAASIVQEAVFR